MSVAALPAVHGLLALPKASGLAQAAAQGHTLALDYVDGALALCPTQGREKALKVDFVGGRQGWRASQDRYRHELVVKSCLSGIKHERTPRVIDATAGLGRDAFLLACAGAQVVLMERQPVLAAMLRDGIQRLARVEPALADRMSVIEGDAASLLADQNDSPDAVLLDPMFPARQKSAAVKKELMFLQQLETPPDADEEQQLLTAARSVGASRVVVKRPSKAPPLAGKAPAFEHAGKAVRFDVYLSQS